MKTEKQTTHIASVRQDFRTGQFVPQVDGKDESPTSFDEGSALRTAQRICDGLNANHTALPWSDADGVIIPPYATADGQSWIADTRGAPNAKANAAFIVRACNCHEELVAMLERLAEKTKRANDIQHSGGQLEAEDWSELYQLHNEVRAIIAKARGAQ